MAEPIASSSTSEPINEAATSKDVLEDAYHPQAPNGGYGWVVVAAGFLMHVIADGVAFSFGILFPAIQDKFSAGKGESAMVGSLFLALPSLAGPVASLWIDTFGYRKTCIAGGAFASLGFLISPLVNSLWWMYLTFGVISGFGLCLSYGASIVAVTNYFTTHRALATGLTVSGTGIGTFIFAPFIEWLMEEYELDGTLLILSGLLFNLCALGALVRDLNDGAGSTVAVSSGTGDAVDVGEGKAFETGDPECQPCPPNFSIPITEYQLETQQLRKALSVNAVDHKPKSHKNHSLNQSNCFNVDTGSTLYLHFARSPVNCLHQKNKANGNLDFTIRKRAGPNDMEKIKSHEKVAMETETLTQGNKDTCVTVNTANGNKGAKIYRAFANSGNFVFRALHIELFTQSPTFALFCLNSLLLYTFCDIPYINLPEYASAQFPGVSDRDASFLVSIIGIVNIPGMIAYGLLADLKSVNKMLLYTVSCLLCGCCVAAPPFVRSYAALAVSCAGFGASVAANYTLATVLLVQVLPRHQFVAGYGLSSLAEGIGMLIGPFTAGYLFDITRSYTTTFISGGVGIVLSGICLVPLLGIFNVKKGVYKVPDSSVGVVDAEGLID